MWIWGRLEVDFLLEGLRDQIGTAHHGPADDVAVPTEVLGGRMNDEIDAVTEGLQPHGLAKVLSMTVRTLFRLATSTMAGMSQTLSTGLVNVSM